MRNFAQWHLSNLGQPVHLSDKCETLFLKHVRGTVANTSQPIYRYKIIVFYIIQNTV